MYIGERPYHLSPKEGRNSMDDARIIDLYWARAEEAIDETAAKYGGYCHAIAYNILGDREDSEECVSDTYMRAWNAMPPQKPNNLRTFLGKITRNLSLNKYEKNTAKKRGSNQVDLALEELQECIPSGETVEQAAEGTVIAGIIGEFLESLPPETRRIFMRRYWYLSSIKEIALDYGLGESKVKMTLLRARNGLKEALEKEGIII